MMPVSWLRSQVAVERWSFQCGQSTVITAGARSCQVYPSPLQGLTVSCSADAGTPVHILVDGFTRCAGDCELTVDGPERLAATS
jgi:hypothetical protein